MKLKRYARQFAAVTLAVCASWRGALAAEPVQSVYLVPNFHPACCGWLADWSTERNFCGNSYLDHLDRVRDDPDYAFALSEVPNLLAILQFEPQRLDELKQRVKDGRVELVNAFFLEPTINLSGGEALVKSGVEGLRWQTAVMNSRPRFAWMIDVTGGHEQMAQIVSGLGLEALVYCRHNPTDSTLHWFESPDGTRALAISPSSGSYADWGEVFGTREPLSTQAIQALAKDARERANQGPLTADQLRKLLAGAGGPPRRTPTGAPVLILGGYGDYNVAPIRRSYPAEFLKQWRLIAPDVDLRFTTPGKYLDAVSPAIKSGQMQLPVARSGTRYSFNAFWIECPRVKTSYRRAEHSLQAAEMLATVASLKAGNDYPAQSLYQAWLMLLLNMDRNTLWGSAGGMVFESDRSWDARDRFEAAQAIAGKALTGALEALLPKGDGIAFFNPLNWERSDPVVVPLAGSSSLAGAACQSLPDGQGVLCQLELPSVGARAVAASAKPPAASRPITLPDRIETKHYSARIDPNSGALVSLRLRPSGREMLGGPANVIVAEKPKRQIGEPGNDMVDRPEREPVASSSQFAPKVAVTTGPIATVVAVDSQFYGGGACRRTMTFYRDYPRIDFETELNDIPDQTVVVAEFPLAKAVTEVRRGIPYGFSHGAWGKPNPNLHGWTEGIVPAVRWSHYALEGGGGVALLDRGLTGRELTGQTPILFLLNATDKYYGYTNSWLSGRGKHRLSYALVAHAAAWDKARIPQMAWEFNCPPVIAPGRAKARAKSYLRTSDNVIVEAMRREGQDIELRLSECLGKSGTAEVKLALPHGQAALTDLVGGHPAPLKGGGAYRFALRPQQIVTMRLRADGAVAAIEPLRDWTPLVPEAKRAALHKRLYRKGHPPRGDAQAQRDSKAAPEDVAAWQAMRLGMFIHWGPVSLKGTEIGWSRGGQRPGIGGTGQIPLEVYDNLYKEFNPTNFDAREWVAVAKAMGAKYIVFTSKHHDGFCEFDSQLTDYKITNTPFRRDVVKELAQACHEAGVKLGFYHSPPDWHHPDYRTDNHARYVQYLHGQARELCSNYGQVDIFWFDGLNSTAQELDAENLLPMIRYLQPRIIINNRAGLPADHDTPEQEIGHFQTGRPWESCITLGDQWAWKPNDNLKPLKQCLQTLIRCAGGDGNLLFNVGPMPTGEIEPRQVERLKEMGQWLGKYGQTVYATRGGPFRPGPWGASTCKGNTVFLHVFDWADGKLVLPGISAKILSSSLLTGGSVEVTQSEQATEVAVAPGDRQEIDTIVALQLDGPAFGLKVRLPPSVASGKRATASNVYQNMAAHAAAKALDDDEATRWAADAGVRQAWLEVDLGQPVIIGSAHLSEAYDRVREFELQQQRDGQWETFARGERIGNALDLKFPPVTAQRVRLNVLKATDGPTIWEFRLYEEKK